MFGHTKIPSTTGIRDSFFGTLRNRNLLVWTLVKRLAPTYYRKLGVRLVDTGRFRELPDWRKAFKAAWKRCAAQPCVVPFKIKYRPDPRRWICTCRYFSTSRFLICKHLVRTVTVTSPVFFLQVTRNRTSPFWSHPLLVPLNPAALVEMGAVYSSAPEATTAASEHLDVDASSVPAPWPQAAHPRADEAAFSAASPSDDEEDDATQSDTELVDFGAQGTFRERMSSAVDLLRDLADGLEFQVQFNDDRMLRTVEHDAAGALTLARQIQAKEKSFNSTRGAVPRTWDASTMNIMFYRPRPSAS